MGTSSKNRENEWSKDETVKRNPERQTDKQRLIRLDSTERQEENN